MRGGGYTVRRSEWGLTNRREGRGGRYEGDGANEPREDERRSGEEVGLEKALNYRTCTSAAIVPINIVTPILVDTANG